MKKKQIRHFYIAECKKYKREVEPIYEFTTTTQKNGHCRYIFIREPWFFNRYGILDTKTGYFIVKGLQKLNKQSFNILCMFFSQYLPVKEQSKNIKRVSRLPKWKEQEE